MKKDIKKSQPIKRHIFLQPMSRDHHHALLLVWKIRKGLSQNTESSRMIEYVNWFYQSYLLPHIEWEEKYIYPILGNQNELIIRALAEHQLLTQYIQSLSDTPHLLTDLADLLEQHIRFEERVVFNLIQTIASEEQIKMLEANLPNLKFSEHETIKFWE
jgi:hemerythrin-like domain-containing protein